MTITTQVETIGLEPRAASRLAGIRSGDFPVIPALILLGIAFVAIFANLLAPHNPEIGSLTARFRPPFWQTGGSTKYLLGTDQLGRDVLSRLIFGARVSMVVGFTAVIFAGVIGTALGILSGYLGGAASFHALIRAVEDMVPQESAPMLDRFASKLAGQRAAAPKRAS